MGTAVLISIQPKWVSLIASGKKTVEVRKTAPALMTPFKCYIYCTKAKTKLITVIRDGDDIYGDTYHGKPFFVKSYADGNYDSWLYGRYRTVVGEFVCTRMVQYARYTRAGDLPRYMIKSPGGYPPSEIHHYSLQLTPYALDQYGKGAPLFGWEISDLKLYDEPKPLSDFWYPPERYCESQKCNGCPYDALPNEAGDYDYDCEWHRPILRAPQSWCYVGERE